MGIITTCMAVITDTVVAEQLYLLFILGFPAFFTNNSLYISVCHYACQEKMSIMKCLTININFFLDHISKQKFVYNWFGLSCSFCNKGLL